MSSFIFKLEWEEVDEDLREQKVDEAIEYMYDIGDLPAEDDDGNKMSLEEYLDDEKIRKEVEEKIKKHFPICFYF